MIQQTIFNEAISRIKERRAAAEARQIARTQEIREKIPETVEIERGLRQTSLALFEAGGREDSAERIERIRKNCTEAQNMMQKVLVARGYPEDYLKLRYSCPLCDDTGFRGAQPCSCLLTEIGRIGAERLNQKSPLALCSFENFDLSYYSDLPEKEREAMATILGICRGYSEDFIPQKAGHILMTGATGLGKTHLSLSIANEVLRQGCTAVYDSAGNILSILEEDHFRHTEQSAEEADAVNTCDLLIIDDFGTEFRTPFAESAFYLLLNSRMNAGRPMIINTNFKMQEIIERYGSRIASRLATFTILQFFGKDIRLKKAQSRRSGKQNGETV